MISWLPRRLPNELKSVLETPRSVNHFPAGPLAGNDPAGEMWSVVIESPSFNKTLAFSILLIGFGVG